MQLPIKSVQGAQDAPPFFLKLPTAQLSQVLLMLLQVTHEVMNWEQVRQTLATRKVLRLQAEQVIAVPWSLSAWQRVQFATSSVHGAQMRPPLFLKVMAPQVLQVLLALLQARQLVMNSGQPTQAFAKR